MITSVSNECPTRDSYPQPILPIDAADRLADLLGELVQLVETLQNVSQINADRGSPDPWDDEEDTYLEVDLPGQLESEIDINIHAGRVYIRVPR